MEGSVEIQMATCQIPTRSGLLRHLRDEVTSHFSPSLRLRLVLMNSPPSSINAIPC